MNRKEDEIRRATKKAIDDQQREREMDQMQRDLGKVIGPEAACATRILIAVAVAALSYLCMWWFLEYGISSIFK